MKTSIPETWAQGRTAYGGLTAALSALAAERIDGELPPMRSAQVAFVGPAMGEVSVKAEVLRRGKSTTFVGSDLSTEKGTACRSTLVYGSGRESMISMTDFPQPDVPHHSELDLLPPDDVRPAFIKNFDIKVGSGGLPFMGVGDHHMAWWCRHQDPKAWNTETGLLALGDVTPPAIAPLMKGPAPVSSVTWQMDFLTDDLSTENGWYLLYTHAERATEGWSGQDMGVWASDGRPIASARQTIVVFV